MRRPHIAATPPAERAARRPPISVVGRTPDQWPTTEPAGGLAVKAS